MTSRRRCSCVNCITPPHILKRLVESADPEIRNAALRTMLRTERLRGERVVRASFAGALAAPVSGRRTIFDCRHETQLDLATIVRTEDGNKSTDVSVNRAFDGLGITYKFYQQIYNRNSIDGRGMRLDGYVHDGVGMDNAFWDGARMVFGDGDGRAFTDFTGALDVIAHELTHGVTQFTAGLAYQGQSGALNESISDVFGSLVKQWSLGQTAAQADWLIGAEIFTPQIKGDALRSLKAPGTAYDNDLLGRDPQPADMSGYQRLPDTPEGDNGGVHINSGIPNHAFYLVAMAIGGHAWEAPGHIWYESLLASTTDTQFQDFAETTYSKAGQLYGAEAQTAVRNAWAEVGIMIDGRIGAVVPSRAAAAPGRVAAVRPDESLATLQRTVDVLAREVDALKRTARAPERESRAYQ
jgi:Zn-dependent metalloprotease